MRKLFIIVAICVLLLTSCSWNRTGEPENAGPEAFFRANLARTGEYQSPSIKNPAETAWEFQTEDWVETVLVVVESSAYFGSYDGNFYAVDTTTGSERWRFPLNNPVLSSPAVSGDLVFVGSMDGTLYALERTTGENRWQFSAQGSILASPAVANGLVYIGSESGILYAINVNNGQEAWHIQLSQPILFSAALSDGLLIFVDILGNLTAVKAINGEQVWQMQIREGSATSGPAIKNGTAYLTFIDSSQKGSLYAVDLATQTVRWQYPLPAESYTAPAVGEALVFVTDISGMVTAVTQETGTMQWQFPSYAMTFSAPALTGNVLYFGSLDQNLYAIDTQNGQELWHFPLDSGVSSPSVYDSVLYVGSESGKVVAIPSND
jgi:outer membrane protein assembly factor BamB